MVSSLACILARARKGVKAGFLTVGEQEGARDGLIHTPPLSFGEDQGVVSSLSCILRALERTKSVVSSLPCILARARMEVKAGFPLLAVEWARS